MDSENTRAALEAIEQIEDVERQADRLRAARDEAIVGMNREDGMTPPQIARRLKMSTSNVRRVIELADARDQRE